MPQLFPRSANNIARITLLAIVLVGAVVVGIPLALDRSSYITQVGDARQQPVPFSHRHHFTQLGIDCRFCHVSVEESNFAGIPPTKTCMTCHSQIWTNAQILEPVRESWRTGKSLEWIRVHDLPDFVYFNHSIHVKKGIGCESCHGRVDQMTLTWKENTLQMGWCLDCHRNPEKNIRQRDNVFKFKVKQVVAQATLGPQLVDQYHVNKSQLADCSVCHR